jgi:hypothetical protein
VSATTEQQHDPREITTDPRILAFVKSEMQWGDRQSAVFLDSSKFALATAEDQARVRWELKHKQEITAADQLRAYIANAAWALSGLVAVSLIAAVGGTGLGWYHREREIRFRQKP